MAQVVNQFMKLTPGYPKREGFGTEKNEKLSTVFNVCYINQSIFKLVLPVLVSALSECQKESANFIKIRRSKGTGPHDYRGDTG